MKLKSFDKSVLQFYLNLLDQKRQSVILVKKVFLEFQSRIIGCHFHYNAFWKSRILWFDFEDNRNIRICFDEDAREIAIYFYYTALSGGLKCKWILIPTNRTINMSEVNQFIELVNYLMNIHRT